MSESRRSTLWAFVPDLVEAGAYTLDSDEARHVTARRLRVGDALVLFDGAGRRAAAQVEAIRKKSVEVVAEVVEVEPEKAAGHVLATAIPKGD